MTSLYVEYEALAIVQESQTPATAALEAKGATVPRLPFIWIAGFHLHTCPLPHLCPGGGNFLCGKCEKIHFIIEFPPPRQLRTVGATSFDSAL